MNIVEHVLNYCCITTDDDFKLHSLFLCSLEQRNLELENEMVSLHEELDQERKKYTMAEIKLRNAERAKDDAERRNQMLQKEMEQFFSTFSDLTATGATTAPDPRRPDRNNPIWIQWREAWNVGWDASELTRNYSTMWTLKGLQTGFGCWS